MIYEATCLELDIEPVYTLQEELHSITECINSVSLTEGVGDFLLELLKKIKDAFIKLWNWITGKTSDADSKVKEKEKAAEKAIVAAKAKVKAGDKATTASLNAKLETIKKIGDTTTIDIPDCEMLIKLAQHLQDEAVDSLKTANGMVDTDSFNKRYESIVAKKSSFTISSTDALIKRAITDIQDKCTQDINSIQRFIDSKALDETEKTRAKNAISALQYGIPKIIGRLTAIHLAVKAKLSSEYDKVTESIASEF